MAHGFVAGLAHGDQVSLSVAVSIGVKHIQRQIRPVLNMVHMMDHDCSAELATRFA